MITLTRFNQTRDGYTKRDEHQITLDERGQDALNLITQEFGERKRAPRAWSFGVFEDGQMSGATWRRSTALVLDYLPGSDLVESFATIAGAMDKTRLGHFLVDACDRYGTRTIAVVIPLSEHVSSERYARLVYVLLEEMKALGVSNSLVKGTSAMSHQIHLHDKSEVVWRPGRSLNPTQKIKATKNAAQNMDRDRFTVGARAAEVQVDKPTLTACDDGLFEW